MLEETLFILIWDLEWETIGRVVKPASYMTTKKNWTKNLFFKKATFSCFFLLSLSKWLSTEFRTNFYVSRRNLWGLFNWKIETLLSYHHSRNLSKKTCQMFSETFWAWFSELSSTCPEENFFDATHFLEKSGFYNQLFTLSDTMMQILATGVSACQSEVHSTLPEKLFEEEIFWTNVNLWSVIEIERKSFGRIVKTAFYKSSGPLWREIHFLGKIICMLSLSQLKWYSLGLLQMKLAGLSNELFWSPVEQVEEKVVSLK